jgi:hypothetical protein
MQIVSFKAAGGCQLQEASMTRIVTTAVTLACFMSATAFLSSINVSPALAQGSCATQAMSKDGKPLSGAAKTASVKKCCETAAVSKDGKPLSGAAKDASIKKCVGESS